MGEVHDLIERSGKRAALLMADLDRQVVEAAAAYMADEDAGTGFLYSGWCQAALPHRKLPDAEGWAVQSERIALIVQPGMRLNSTGKPEPIGVPYGSRARLILLYLQSEALRTGSREVELGKSLRTWLGKMGIPAGGKSIAGVRDQAERISRCSLSFNIRSGRLHGLVNQTIMEKAIFLEQPEPDGQGSLFAETARLSEAFFAQLQRHPVPIEEAAIRAINNNSMALDIYAWLAYRLHVLSAPKHVTWKALRPQFGGGVARDDHFKEVVLANLKLALAVYRDAKVKVEDAGLMLYPSRPPVSPRSLPSS
jgi:Plasmid encoded RepA protein